MNKKKIKVGACIMVHNMAPFISACINSLQWTDGIYLYDDHSTDKSSEIAISASTIPLIVEKSKEKKVAFKSGELKTRNYILKRAFKVLQVDVMVIADADELFSQKLRKEIEKSFSKNNIDSMAFSIWHLYTNTTYLHIWEDTINDVKMIDPHTRIIKKDKKYKPLFKDGSHPILEAGENTACLHGPYHFHLKYYHKSTLPNYSLFFLPKNIRKKDVNCYLKKLPFSLPIDIKKAMKKIRWSKMPKYKETPHYTSRRKKFTKPQDALLHPRYYK